MTVAIKRVYYNEWGAGAAIAEFHDGHKMTFVPSSGGYGMPHNLDRVFLEYSGNTVAMYHSPYQHPINFTPYGFVTMAQGYTPARIAEYWAAAAEHARIAFDQRRLREAHLVISLGGRDLDDIRAI